MPLQVVLPVNGDPFIGMFETPVTSSPLVAGFLSNLPAYRTQVSPLLRGTEIGLAHGFLVVRFEVQPASDVRGSLSLCSPLDLQLKALHAAVHGFSESSLWDGFLSPATRRKNIWLTLTEQANNATHRELASEERYVCAQTGPFIKLGPLRNVEGVAEISGSLSGAGLVLILALALTIYGAVSFQNEKPQVGLKTLSGALHGPFGLPIWQLCQGWACVLSAPSHTVQDLSLRSSS